MTWRILHLDLQAGLPRLEAGRTAVYTVFWWGSLPLGARAFLPEELPLRRDQLLTLAAELVAEQLACRVDTLGGAARASFDGRPLIEPSLAAVREFEGVADAMNDLARPAEGAAADLSVIVCTRDRPEALASCLSALVSQRRPPGEILVVDNSAGRTAEPACRNFPQVGYVHEPRPGLSRARNAGIAACMKPLVRAGELRLSRRATDAPDPLFGSDYVPRLARHLQVITGITSELPADAAPQSVR